MAGSDITPGRWGRWGADDERGALNFIDPAKIARASRLVRAGRTYPLAIPIRRNGPIAGGDVRNAPLHLMRLDGGDFSGRGSTDVGTADDYLMMATHSSTHLDALCHVWRGDRLYNGFSTSEVRSTGAWKLGIEKVGAIVTRGVLADIAGHHGLEHLPPGFVITERHIAEALAAHDLGLERGDALLVRTGWLGAFKALGPGFNRERPGIGLAAARRLVDAEVSVVGADTQGVEVVPSEDGTTVPVHAVLLHENGVFLLELAHLDDLAREGVHEFLFVAAPLPILGGVGGPVVPVAIV